ncbi:hypothetical protein [Enterococcus sp. AZ109]|uniref:hypothetical protein n=1 Tax=Enterococcus sp. AZ109 TaxID=2774634 RepID=UPI003F222866
MSQRMILGLLLILTAFIVANARFKDKKLKEYKNDERWQLIVMKSSKILMIYFYALFLITALGYIYFAVFSASSPTIALRTVLQYAFYLFMIRNVIEYGALRYYDNAF